MSVLAPPNRLLEPVQYKYTETSWGTWRRYVYPNGRLFEEFTSHARLGRIPWLHVTRGKCPETGKRVVARGVVAIGRVARGFVAIGQASFGVIAIGQLAVGLVIGIGQASTGIYSLGQLALGLMFGLGQFATGYVAIGQFGLGKYVLAQIGLGTHVADTRAIDPIARQFFAPLLGGK